MKKLKVAIPSNAPGGLEADLGQHFGHCEIYTIVEIEDGKAAQVTTLANIPHEQGGCLAPVKYLADHGVQTMIAGGMGMRPLVGFQDANIEVYFSDGRQTVGQAVEAFIKKELPKFSTDFTCGGGGGHCGS